MSTITPKRFRAEAQRRLLDASQVKRMFGLQTRKGVRLRVQAGTLPPPIVSQPRGYALWDRDELEPFLPKEKP